MDNTPIYILMCEKAVEVQEFRKPDDEEVWVNGDFYTDDIIKRPTTPVESCVFEDASDPPCSMYNPVWLPRQDQLQEMVFTDKNDTVNIQISKFCNTFCLVKYPWSQDDNICTATYIFTSMEQLWLAFVMKEKFNKVWNDNKWIFQNL